MIQVLPKDKQDFIFEMIKVLARVEGIKAIALGGSYARGSATANSDVDLSIYYSENSLPSINDLRDIAKQFVKSNDLIITDFYEWGDWVNGGAWLNTPIGKVDWLYRNVDQVNRVIEEAKQGKFTWDFRQQPPYGFFSVMYLADLQNNIALYDPENMLTQLKEEIKIYPERLRQAIIQEHLWSVEFSYINAVKMAERNSIYETVGCMTRMAAELTQVLFALNKVYFSTEKEVKMIESFSIKPRGYLRRINDILSCPGTGEVLVRSLGGLNKLIEEVIELSHPLYNSKYGIKNEKIF